MHRQDLKSDFPATIECASAPAGMRYHLHPGYHALHGQAPAPAMTVIAHLEAEKIWICQQGRQGDKETRGEGERGGQGNREHHSSITPVYTLAREAPDNSSPSGRGAPAPLAVPTGAVFIRFKEGVSAESHRAAIEQSGYTITNIPPYAPHATWVEATNGGIAAALNGVSKLAELPDVENVEPQMLQQMR
jgi:hypothetical protein